MGRIARLEARLSALEEALASVKFTSDAPTVTVEVPVPVLDSNGNPTGSLTTGYLQVKTGFTEGALKVINGTASITMR